MLILSVVKSYDFNTASCSNTKNQQSPISISSSKSLYFDEKYFRFLQNNYEFLTTYNQWSFMPELNAIGVKPAQNQTDFGYFTFVKDWAMYKFNLNKIVFRVDSEHTIDGNSFNVEMQLIHSIDNTFYQPGRRVDLGVNHMVISVFFLVTEENDPAASKLFDFMNLNGFAVSSYLDST